MVRQPVRSFSSARKLSPRLVAGAVVAIAAICVTAAFAAHESTNAEAGEAAQAAKKILHAAGTYAVSSAQAGCPTISELVDADKLDESARTEDAWGNRFRIACDDKGPRVLSAGPDGRMGTSDDVSFTR